MELVVTHPVREIRPARCRAGKHTEEWFGPALQSEARPGPDRISDLAFISDGAQTGCVFCFQSHSPAAPVKSYKSRADGCCVQGTVEIEALHIYDDLHGDRRKKFSDTSTKRLKGFTCVFISKSMMTNFELIHSPYQNR